MNDSLIKVLIPGHNVKWFALICIKSLVSCSLFDYEDIIFFDDNSTDGTKECLEELGVKVITWDKETHDRLSVSDSRENLCARVSMILNSAYKQIDAEFLLVLDSDMIFFKDPMQILIPNIDGVLITGLRRLQANEHGSFPNIDQKMCFMHYSVLKELDVLGDDIEDYEKRLGLEDIIDTGFSFYKKIMNNNIPVKFIEDDSPEMQKLYCGEYSLHFGWTSSSMRDDKFYCDSLEDCVTNISEHLSCDEVKSKLEEIGIDAGRVLSDYEKNLQKSKGFD